MSNKTTTAILGALTLGALAWLGGTAGAGPQRSPVQTHGTAGAKANKPWGCESSGTKTQCSLCCLAAGQKIREACEDWGFDEDYCQSKGQKAVETCETASCPC